MWSDDMFRHGFLFWAKPPNYYLYRLCITQSAQYDPLNPILAGGASLLGGGVYAGKGGGEKAQAEHFFAQLWRGFGAGFAVGVMQLAPVYGVVYAHAST
jgi:hypothetical protein